MGLKLALRMFASQIVTVNPAAIQAGAWSGARMINVLSMCVALSEYGENFQTTGYSQTIDTGSAGPPKTSVMIRRSSGRLAARTKASIRSSATMSPGV